MLFWRLLSFVVLCLLLYWLLGRLVVMAAGKVWGDGFFLFSFFLLLYIQLQESPASVY